MNKRGGASSSSEDLASLRNKFAELAMNRDRDQDESTPPGECPRYSQVRETKDGRRYVLERVPGKKRGQKSTLKRRFCRERNLVKKSSSAKSSRSFKHSPQVLEQGEYILEKTLQPRNASDRKELDKLRHEFRAHPAKHVWLGVTSSELDCWDQKFSGYNIGQAIGKGSFGTVHEACRQSNCRYVLKISYFEDAYDREVAAREIAVMQQLNDSGITARLINAKMCSDKALMLMERYDMSADELGERQYTKMFGRGSDVLRGSLLFTDSQIRQLFELAVKLSALGVHHGDLKLDNILYRVAEDRFVIIDFGFTGTYRPVATGGTNGAAEPLLTGRWGFTHAMGCSQHKPVPQHLVPYSNVWQLTVDLGVYPLVLIAVDDPVTRKVKEIRLLVGLGPRFAKILTREAIHEIQKQCPEPKGELWQSRKEFSRMREILLQRIQPFFV